MQEAEYWIWLQMAVGPGENLWEILDYFGTPRDMMEAGREAWKASRLFSNARIASIEKASLDKAHRVLASCAQHAWQVLTLDNPAYPQRLRDITNPAAVLYIEGNLPELDEYATLGIVGSRSATEYGCKATRNLATGLAKAGAIVVSGGALGIDTAAHEGALAGGGLTLALLGCGFGYPYLMENEPLRRRISRHGALITEFPPGTPASRYSFPIRNRLISGLSLGTVVAEAGARSGALLTAEHALEQGRDVFVIPGGVMSSYYTGTNRLLRDGAKPVFSPLDVLEEYRDAFPHKLDLREAHQLIPEIGTESDKNPLPVPLSYQIEKAAPVRPKPRTALPRAADRPPKKPAPDFLSEDEARIYALFAGESLPVDMIIAQTGLSSGKVLSALTTLEIHGLIRAQSGRRYTLYFD